MCLKKRLEQLFCEHVPLHRKSKSVFGGGDHYLCIKCGKKIKKRGTG